MGPNSWQGAGEGATGDSGGAMSSNPAAWGSIGNGLGSIFGGLFGGDAGAPFSAAEQQYSQFANQANQGQQPFWQAGTNALPQYQNWLNSQKDPSGYINSLMGNYQQSPYASYLQQQAMRAGTNAASASGLTGSTPFAQQMQQTAAGISSGDLNNWLSRVLGINTQYGNALGNQIGWGANAANQMSTTYNKEGEDMAQAEKDRVSSQQNQTGSELGGIGSALGGLGSLLGWL